MEDLLNIIQHLGYTTRHVVITGGEPCIHDLLSLTSLLDAARPQLAARMRCAGRLADGFVEGEHARRRSAGYAA